MDNLSNLIKLSKGNQICKGISLPSHLWLQIDKDKGDISRSRFIQRLIEKAYNIEIDNKNQAISSHDSSPARQNISCELSTHKKPLEMEIHEYK
jgi:hypothetical protein